MRIKETPPMAMLLMAALLHPAASAASNASGAGLSVARLLRMGAAPGGGSGIAASMALPQRPLDGQCPPCFDCHLAMFPCRNFGNCSDVTGKCVCPTGFGGNDCSQPLCASLVAPERPARSADGGQCTCDPGWSGVNCNVCTTDSVCNSLVPSGQNATCYNSMSPVRSNKVMCDVTNPAIISLLKDKRPQITLGCDRDTSTCEFQFWAGQVESFYCQMHECQFTQEQTLISNKTAFTCPHMQCKCYPDHLLCEHSGLDFTEWFNNPEEGPYGPGTFSCEEKHTSTGVERSCTFSEPHMNEVIEQFFGDPQISLLCPQSGECLHYTQVPGYIRPELPMGFSPLVIVFMAVGGIGLVAVVIGSIVWLQRKANNPQEGYVPLRTGESQPDGLTHEMMSDHLPCTIVFRDLSYVIETDKTIDSLVRPVRSAANSAQPSDADTHQRILSDASAAANDGRASSNNSPDPGHLSDPEAIDMGRTEIEDPDGLPIGMSLRANPGRKQKQKLVVLEGVQGMVGPGQVMAIMGGSGAGKTTLLDILARKNKTGIVSGDILVNGRFMDNQDYKSIIGYVDQEDTLMDTLTVYETILYSALLRLPKTMTYEAKVRRVEETMLELDIVQIANRRIGSSGKRGLSGGEKRRVSIACELVTSPSIIFLDEPTSGLDTYNAYNVIESLVSLSRSYQRTVIFTIHQPRSSVYALFDQLVLLAKGRIVYSGPAQEAAILHFSSLGFECPLGFNIADYLVDLTMHISSPDPGSNADSEAGEGSAVLSGVEIDSASPTTPLLTTVSAHTSTSADHALALEGNRRPRRRSTIRTIQEAQLFSRRSVSGRNLVVSPVLTFPGPNVNGGNGEALSASDEFSRVDREHSRSTSMPMSAPADTLSNHPWTPHLAETSQKPRGARGSRSSRASRTNQTTNQPAGRAVSPKTPNNPMLNRASAISARRIRNLSHAHNPNAAVIRPPLSEQLSQLIDAYKNSRSAEQIRVHAAESIRAAYPNGVHSASFLRARSRQASFSAIGNTTGSPSIATEFVHQVREGVGSLLVGGGNRAPGQRSRASWWTQFMILSGRTFKNLYRNPDLLRTHYLISIVVAFICGLLFWKLDNTLAGFQNRLGVMFFICAVFGFGCLSSMQVFASERLIFVRERANRYYTPITYFVPKILFDVLPLRVVPPLILGLICYHMIGLRPDTFIFLRFLLVLVLFNLTAASVCLAISIIFKDMAVASLIATLVMLFEMLFGGLLLNKASIPPAFEWLQRISFFNYAFEALVVNEVIGLTLVEEKFGLKIDVPGSLILQAFGLNAQAYWTDVKLLGIMSSIFFGIAFIWLQLVVKERR